MPMIEPITAEEVYAEREKSGDGLAVCSTRLRRKRALEALSVAYTWSDREQRQLHAEILRKIIEGEY